MIRALVDIVRAFGTNGTTRAGNGFALADAGNPVAANANPSAADGFPGAAPGCSSGATGYPFANNGFPAPVEGMVRDGCGDPDTVAAYPGAPGGNVGAARVLPVLAKSPEF